MKQFRKPWLASVMGKIRKTLYGDGLALFDNVVIGLGKSLKALRDNSST